MFGLSNEVYLKIMNIVKKYKYDFYIFGSRARGDYKKNSDIDIAIYGEVTDKEEFYIRNDFDIINIQYKRGKEIQSHKSLIYHKLL